MELDLIYFVKELITINKESFGMLSISEIANSETFVEFYNKTIVLGGTGGQK
ncbi:hypothetical protein Asulf_01710 [Archaeoglobus sulfaticallidus PM70-1]|uniref:Uncharacterized protein n=1 Tax=Archaeoglobus sulfaticallidus PM70-1 TaxID=387631 RepID=N0BM53_9EURY|nr:hypothetical protein [Archaeoglobus sulfaticallidus]AGK61681.1 hypothetical protein Asulf_01710 [Archaeoglobus sulfaticallidus PM70-1]